MLAVSNISFILISAISIPIIAFQAIIILQHQYLIEEPS